MKRTGFTKPQPARARREQQNNEQTTSMKTLTIYEVIWDNGHASGVLPEVFTSRREAESYGRNWKQDMVAVDDNPKEAREEYSWEIIANPFYIEREYEWPGHSYRVYTTDKIPRSPIVKEASYKHAIESTKAWLTSKDSKP